MRRFANTSRLARSLLVLAALAAGLVTVAGAPQGTPAGAATKGTGKGVSTPLRPKSSTGIAGWRLVGHYTETSVQAGEGVATVTESRGRSEVIYRGIGTIPSDLKAEGWTHVGDPDADDGYVVDAYQGPSTSKMFLVTTPSGRAYQYVHTLVSGELYNNSFDAIAPGGQWMVAGTWTTQRTLQIYPTPLLNRRTPRHGGALRLTGYIKLDHAVYYVQGCDFVSATVLICTSTGSSKLFTNPKPLLEVELSSPLRGRSVQGHVIDLGSIPEQSTCTGTFEAEGIDYDTTTGVLRVEIIQPRSCILHTTVYEYKRAWASKASQ